MDTINVVSFLVTAALIIYRCIERRRAGSVLLDLGYSGRHVILAFGGGFFSYFLC